MVELEKMVYDGGKRGKSSNLPWHLAEVGQSFLAPMKSGVTMDKLQISLCNLARYHWGKGNYRTRQEDGGVRVFKVGEMAK